MQKLASGCYLVSFFGINLFKAGIKIMAWGAELRQGSPMEAWHVPFLGKRHWLLNGGWGAGGGRSTQTLWSLNVQLVPEAPGRCLSQAHCCPRSCGPAVQGKSSKQAFSRTCCCIRLSTLNTCPAGPCLQLQEYSKNTLT